MIAGVPVRIPEWRPVRSSMLVSIDKVGPSRHEGRDVAIELMRCSVQPDRAQFLLDHDRYTGWVLLAAYEGSFAFSLEPSQEVALVGRREARELAGDCVPGDLVVCPPLTTLRRRITTTPTSFLFAEFRPAYEPLPGRSTVRDVHRLHSTYDYIAETCAASPGRERQDMLAHLIADLLFLINAELGRVDRPSDVLMTEVAGFLEENAFSTSLSLSALADRLGLSPSRLTRRFRSAYGSTPMAYLTATRLARARQLLVETDQTLDTIAAKCGYQNAFYFSRVFRQKMGQNPSSYRRSYRI